MAMTAVRRRVHQGRRASSTRRRSTRWSPASAGVTDLLVLSHGWNNDMAEARALYDELLGNVEKLLDARDSVGAPAALAAARTRTFAAVPSLLAEQEVRRRGADPRRRRRVARRRRTTRRSRGCSTRSKNDPERLGEHDADAPAARRRSSEPRRWRRSSTTPRRREGVRDACSASIAGSGDGAARTTGRTSSSRPTPRDALRRRCRGRSSRRPGADGGGATAIVDAAAAPPVSAIWSSGVVRPPPGGSPTSRPTTR